MVSLDSLRDYQKLLFDNFNSTSVQGLFALTTSVENGLIDQPKPQYSYIGLIAMAILSSPDRKMILSEVYDWIVHHYPYFRSRGSGWRNSIRHNLSLNDCFVKAGRAANGKGHYWAIHPANLRDFERGDFRRRRAQRKVRRHMGLSVPDGESSDESPSTSPRPPLNEQQNVNNLGNSPSDGYVCGTSVHTKKHSTNGY
ncbi:unnamed protein product, partial [Mesorhabditis belari]|uniref:Fork-head domain-containing protein n=1 Tax=Mesorhabditis belari TaxID=2138241 RepID=A0AAF3F631_9BILA